MGMKKNKITTLDVKHALQDARFRDTLPKDMDDLIRKYNQNRSCPCNHKLYREILTRCETQLNQYYPNREVSSPDQELANLAENHWSVINCHVDEIEVRLRKLSKGRKQIAISRYEDRATIIINEIDIVY